MGAAGRIVIRPLRDEELGLYLEIHGRAIRGLAAGHYPPDIIDGWCVPATEDTFAELRRNPDNEVRLIAELDGTPVGMGSLVAEKSELRACYVVPEGARRGCGSALVREIERLARDSGVTELHLAASLNAEPFYTSLGYLVTERSEVVLDNNFRMPAVWMKKVL